MSACQCIDIIHKTYNIYRDLTKSFWARKDKIAKFGFKNKIAKFCTLDKKWMNISSSTNTHRLDGRNINFWTTGYLSGP